jgi:predicted RNA-binding protein
MCEFKVLLDDEKVMDDVIYVKAGEHADRSVTLRDVLGETKRFENTRILEVDVQEQTIKIKKCSPRPGCPHAPKS